MPFYESSHFDGERGRVVRRDEPPGRLESLSPEPSYRRAVQRYFEQVDLERHGTLRGEYVIHHSNLLAITPDGNHILLSMGREDGTAMKLMGDFCGSAGFRAEVEAILADWHAIPLVTNVPLLSHAFSNNHFHFMTELLPSLRHMGDVPSDCVVVHDSLLRNTYQSQMLVRVLGQRRVIPLQGNLRVVNPFVVQSPVSRGNLDWLRARLPVPSGVKAGRYYLRRGTSITRSFKGGGISETGEFLALLEEYGFQTVTFGTNERTPDEQLTMIQDAQLVLAAHGANLANILNLSAPMQLIEVYGPLVVSPVFVHIARMYGFGYTSIYSEAQDENGNIALDVAALRESVRAALR